MMMMMMVVAHSGAVASWAPGIKPYFSTSRPLSHNSCVKYSSMELMDSRDSSVITILPKVKHTAAPEDNGVSQQSTGSIQQKEAMCPKTKEREVGMCAGPAKD